VTSSTKSEESEPMPYTYTNRKGDTYTLHRREAPAANGRLRVLHFFSRDVRSGAIDDVPQGYEVTEAPSGMPVLRRRA
jgi:hypothetical protein